ncbi:MAG: metallophosphoesterase [Lentisphaeria bacterium]|nr:metallophosphoesterase [Lentisphaeria bacterium]
MTKFVPYLLWLLLFWTLFLRRAWPFSRKIAAGIGLAVVIFPYHLLRWIANCCPETELENWPHEIWLAAQFLYCTAVFCCGFVALDGMLYAVMKWYCRKKELPCRYRHLRIRFHVLVPAAALLSALGIVFSLMPPRVREFVVELENYPSRAEELRIAAVSDLHFDPVYDHRYAARIVRALNNMNPHVIFLLGDFSNTLNGLSPAVLAELKKLSAPEGVYAVTGNHEYYPEGRRNFRFLNSIGVIFLCNEHLKLKDFDLFLAGVNDPWAKTGIHASGRESFLPGIKQAVRGIPHEKTVIMLCHQPKLFPEAAANHVALQLSGHIHGGLFPGLHWIFAFVQKYTSGVYSCGKAKMIVSRGTGVWCGFPCRFGFSGEVLLVKVRRPSR